MRFFQIWHVYADMLWCHIWKKDLEKETVKVKLPFDQVFYGSKFLKKHNFERNFGTEFCAVA